MSNVGNGASGTVLQGTGNGSTTKFSTATYPNTSGNAGNVLTSDGTNFVSSASSGSSIYGDGSDSSRTFDGTTTILGIVPTGTAGNYVYTLIRDIFLSTSTINSGVNIITSSFRIFCNGILTNNGTIKYNGGDGAAIGTAGSAALNGNGSLNAQTSGTNAASGIGGVGNLGTGSIGTNLVNSFGGSGGNGGNGATAGPTANLNTVPLPLISPPRWAPSSVLGYMTNNSPSLVALRGGGGGAGGSGDSSVKGGGGGGGGGIIVITCKYFSGTGAIQARGGNGGSPSSGTNCGGGGGGGGGLIIINSRSISSGSISGQTIDCNGGTHGTGFGSGTNGLDGGNGTVILVPDQL